MRFSITFGTPLESLAPQAHVMSMMVSCHKYSNWFLRGLIETASLITYTRLKPIIWGYSPTDLVQKKQRTFFLRGGIGFLQSLPSHPIHRAAR